MTCSQTSSKMPKKVLNVSSNKGIQQLEAGVGLQFRQRVGARQQEAPSAEAEQTSRWSRAYCARLRGHAVRGGTRRDSISCLPVTFCSSAPELALQRNFEKVEQSSEVQPCIQCCEISHGDAECCEGERSKIVSRHTTVGNDSSNSHYDCAEHAQVMSARQLWQTRESTRHSEGAAVWKLAPCKTVERRLGCAAGGKAREELKEQQRTNESLQAFNFSRPPRADILMAAEHQRSFGTGTFPRRQ
eukprot:766715-Hanusia_phi.AAC.2